MSSLIEKRRAMFEATPEVSTKGSIEEVRNADRTATEWKDTEVHAPMTPQELDSRISEMSEKMKDLAKAMIKLQESKNAVKEIEAERDSLVSQVASRKCQKRLPSRVEYDWSNMTKKRVCVLESGEIYTVTESSISDEEKQLRIDDDRFCMKLEVLA